MEKCKDRDEKSTINSLNALSLVEQLNFEPYVFSGSSRKEYICYVCGKKGSVSNRSLTDSKDSANRIINMFYSLGLFASLTPNDEISPDIKLGACNNHYKNLYRLEEMHKESKIITIRSILDTIK